MPDLIIRTCREADLSRVQELVDELYSDHPGRGRTSPDILRPFAEFSRCEDKGRIVVFEKDKKIVGYAVLVIFFSNEFGGDVIEVDELLVHGNHRGSGIGSRLFQWVESEYPRCVALTLQVAPDNSDARKLYDRIGFTISGNDHMFKLAHHPAGNEACTKASGAQH